MHEYIRERNIIVIRPASPVGTRKEKEKEMEMEKEMEKEKETTTKRKE